MRGANTLSLYDWETARLVRRIDIDARNVIWAEAGTLMAVVTADSLFVLKFNREVWKKGLSCVEKVCFGSNICAIGNLLLGSILTHLTIHTHNVFT